MNNDFIERLNKFIEDLEQVHGFKFSDGYKQKIYKLNTLRAQGKGSHKYQGFGVPCSMCSGEINPNSIIPDQTSQTFIGPECAKKLQFMRVKKQQHPCSNMFGDCIGCPYISKKIQGKFVCSIRNSSSFLDK